MSRSFFQPSRPAGHTSQATGYARRGRMRAQSKNELIILRGIRTRNKESCRTRKLNSWQRLELLVQGFEETAPNSRGVLHAKVT